jgi:hypothetical protein
MRQRGARHGGGAPRVAPARSARDFVEEPEDGDDPVLLAGHRDIEADDQRLGPLGTEALGEAGLTVVRVDRAGQGEDEAGELGLDRGDGRVDRVPAVRLGQRVGAGGIVTGRMSGTGRWPRRLWWKAPKRCRDDRRES